MKKFVKRFVAVCVKCDHEWFPRVENPVACPNCKRTDWNEAGKDYHPRHPDDK